MNWSVGLTNLVQWSLTGADGLETVGMAESEDLEKNYKDLRTLSAMASSITVSLRLNPKQMGLVGWKKLFFTLLVLGWT